MNWRAYTLGFGFFCTLGGLSSIGYGIYDKGNLLLMLGGLFACFAGLKFFQEFRSLKKDKD